MSREGYGITVKTVRDLLKYWSRRIKKLNNFISDRDEEIDDEEYFDDAEYSDDEYNSLDLPIPAGLSVYPKPSKVPIAYNPSRDPQYMFRVALIPKYCLDDEDRLIKIKELKPWEQLPPGLYNKKKAEEKFKNKNEKYNQNFYNPNNLNYNDRFH